MSYIDSHTIRQKFLDFFQSKGHKIVPSAPIVVKNDPTLMFTNAGMNQFKDYFLGNRLATEKRVTDTQKCLRVSGKHNDLEEVGMDTYHHTMFEMLGNWSFGDYFKKEAIDWAWELLTQVYALPADRMYATVFEGSEQEGLERDNEALTLWKAHLADDRILMGNKKDNFWEMGDTGPCGPSSEIHIDLRSEEARSQIDGKELVNQDHPQVVEIWNLVFIQFNRLRDQSLENLPEKHVDTGMGFERLVMAIQRKQSNYDTDVFQPMITHLAEKAGVKYGDQEPTDIALRVIADHIRAISFTIADGQLPSNTKAGYVIRRILRRAVRYGYTFLNFHEPFLYELVGRLASQFEETFPELIQQKDFVTKVILEEETAFLRTLDKGLKKLHSMKEEGKKVIDGSSAFELYDTYGFPFDLTALIASEQSMDVDEKGFEQEMAKQKDRSKQAAKQESGDWEQVHADMDHSHFLGYELLESTSHIVRYRKVEQKKSAFYQLVLDQTPFYAESGGQVGDTGYLEADGERIAVFDTKKENDLIVHMVKKLPTDPSSAFHAVVDEKKRMLTENNHSATHLLHAALRQVLGDHVQQKGSLVNEGTLRFDFSHFSKMTVEEIKEVERIVNERIRQNIHLDEQRNVPIDKAKEMGAMALFGEKYGDYVRVITFDPSYSVELCGGTHVEATGQIGYFKLISEGSVAAGVRRVEAVTAEGAEKYLDDQSGILEKVNELLKSPQDTLKAIEELVSERQALRKEVEVLQREKLAATKERFAGLIEEHDGVKMLVARDEFPDADGVKSLAFQLKNEHSQLIQLIGAVVKEKPLLTVMIDEELVKSHALNASTIVREMSKSIKGGGGGQPFYATAGGKDTSGLERALEAGRSLLMEQMGQAT